MFVGLLLFDAKVMSEHRTCAYAKCIAACRATRT